MDHGREGPLGALGGSDGGVNEVRVRRGDEVYRPEHLSKDQDIALGPGDSVEVRTPGGGGYGSALERAPELVCSDVTRGYYTVAQAQEKSGLIMTFRLTLYQSSESLGLHTPKRSGTSRFQGRIRPR